MINSGRIDEYYDLESDRGSPATLAARGRCGKVSSAKGTRNVSPCEAAIPQPARWRTYASPEPMLPRTAQGLLPACRAQLWPGGIRTRWTTYRISERNTFLPNGPALPGRIYQRAADAPHKHENGCSFAERTSPFFRQGQVLPDKPRSSQMHNDHIVPHKLTLQKD